MPRVTTISSGVRDIAGAQAFEVSPGTIRRMIAELEARHPGLGDLIESRMAIAIDGEIFQDALDATIGPGSEVVLIPRISGG